MRLSTATNQRPKLHTSAERSLPKRRKHGRLVQYCGILQSKTRRKRRPGCAGLCRDSSASFRQVQCDLPHVGEKPLCGRHLQTLGMSCKDRNQRLQPVRHETPKLLFQNIEKEVSGSITKSHLLANANNTGPRIQRVEICRGFSWLLCLLSKSFNFIGDMMHDSSVWKPPETTS